MTYYSNEPFTHVNVEGIDATTKRKIHDRIDYNALARGFVNLLTPEEKNILSFGMIPNPKYKIMVDMIKEKFIKPLIAEGGFYHGLSMEAGKRLFDKGLLREIEHKLSCAIYRNGNLVV